MRRNDDARVLGPYAEKDRWRLVILEKGVRRSEYLAFTCQCALDAKFNSV